jgi:membrane fusion protein, heavy metal efflux system
MKLPFSFRSLARLTAIAAALVAIAAAAFFQDRWLPAAGRLLGRDAEVDNHTELAKSKIGNTSHDPATEAANAHEGESAEEHAAHAGEADGDHEAAASFHLSKQAEANIDMRLAKVEIGQFERTVSVPAMIVERPGWSETQVAAPLTGVVTRIRAMQGETIAPGQPLFDLRLTHEEVVEGQSQFLRAIEELDVVRREIARLQKVADEGAIAGKNLLERKYEQQKLEAILHSQRQALLLHGLTPEQTDEIAAKRTLVKEITVSAPRRGDDRSGSESGRLQQIEDLKVSEGQHVKVGDTLCVLADHSTLYIQGKAFSQDMPLLSEAVENNWTLTAVINGGTPQQQTVPGLRIVYLANKIESESRAFAFYVELPNQLLRTRQDADGRRFSSWRFKPGERVDLKAPVEKWSDRIVLPVDAVVREGAECYVFEKVGEGLMRRAVRVEYSDQYSAVIANDGALTLGAMAVVSGSYQVHLAMKNAAGGAPDPHAGHMH